MGFLLFPHPLQLLQILLLQIFISVSPDMAAIAAFLGPPGHHPGRNALQVVRPTQPREEVDEVGRGIVAIAQLASLVVPRENVVVVVPTFPQSSHRDRQVLHRAYVPATREEVEESVDWLPFQRLLIVRFLAPHVSYAVHEERDVQRNAKPRVEVDPEGIPKGFVPIVDWNAHRKEDGEYEEPQRIQPTRENSKEKFKGSS